MVDVAVAKGCVPSPTFWKGRICDKNAKQEISDTDMRYFFPCSRESLAVSVKFAELSILPVFGGVYTSRRCEAKVRWPGRIRSKGFRREQV